MIKYLCTILILSCLIGCSGNCIRFEGNYDNFGGAIEYCFSPENTEKVGIPVFESENDKKYVFSEEQIKEIKGLLNSDVVIKKNDSKSILEILNRIE